MLNVLKSLLFRLKSTKVFWIILIISACMPILLSVLLGFLVSVADIVEEFAGEEMIMLFENVVSSSFQELVLPNGTPQLMTLLGTSIFLSKEFVDGTIRNTLLSNKSRLSVYFAYFITGMIIGVSCMVVFSVSSLLALGIPYGFGETATFGGVLSGFLVSFLTGIFPTAYIVACSLLFLFATGKQSSAIVLPIIIYMFLPGLVESIVSYALLIFGVTGSTDLSSIASFDYSWIPLMNTTMYDPGAIDGGLVFKIIMYYVLFIGLLGFLGGLACSKKDMK